MTIGFTLDVKGTLHEDVCLPVAIFLDSVATSYDTYLICFHLLA